MFHTGGLDERTREFITVTVLTTMQTLPQLHAHTGAALNVGVTPVELREAVYQCAPFIGFPKTLNAVAVINEVFTARGIDLPLPHQGTTTEAGPVRGRPGDPDPDLRRRDRRQRRRAARAVPRGRAAVPHRVRVRRLLHPRRAGRVTRELLILCLLAALGQPAQIKAHHRQPSPRATPRTPRSPR